MSIDRSLRQKSSLERHRNVLTRAERVARLMAQERFSEGSSALHLPKVAHRKAQAGKKKAAAKKSEAAPAGGATDQK
jgi:small basic protein (TIGR04137 family)